MTAPPTAPGPRHPEAGDTADAGSSPGVADGADGRLASGVVAADASGVAVAGGRLASGVAAADAAGVAAADGRLASGVVAADARSAPGVVADDVRSAAGVVAAASRAGISPVTTVVFDADETLVDLSPAVTGALGAVLAEMRLLSPAAEALTVADLAGDWPPVFAAMRAEPTPDIRRAALARSLARVGLEAELDRIAEVFFAHRFALSRPFDDVLPALAELRQRYTVGFATNGNSRAERCGLAGHFAFELYAHEGGLPKKPATEFFTAVVAAAGCAPAAVVHVGDSWEHDVVGARAAGLRTVWLNRAGAPRPPGPPPDAEVRSLAELPAVLSLMAASPDPEGHGAPR